MDYDRNDSNVDEAWKEAEKGGIGNAKALGRAAEEGASEKPEAGKSSGGGGVAKALEKSAGGGLYTGGMGKAAGVAGKGFGNLKGKGSLKKWAPLGILVVVLAGIGVFVAVSQVLAPFSFVENAKNMFNTTRTGYDMSGSTLMNSYLEGEATADESGDAIDNALSSLEMTDELKNGLQSAGIEYVEIGGRKGLAYQSTTSKEWNFVVADSTSTEGLTGQTVATSKGDVIISAATNLDAASGNRDFVTKLDTGLRAGGLQGHSAGWYGSLAEMYNEQIGNTRDKFRDITYETPDEETYNNTIKENGEKVEISDTSGGDVEICDGEADEDGNCTGEVESTGNDGLKQGMSEENVKSALTSRAKKAMVAGSKMASDECQTAKGVAAVSATSSAVLKIQTMNSGSAFLEAIDKAKVTGEAGAMNAAMKKFSLPGETKALNDESEWETVEGKEHSTGLESAAWNYVAGGGPAPSKDDPLVKTFAYESMITDDAQVKKLKEATDYTDDAVTKCSSITDYDNPEELLEDEGSGPTGGLFSGLADFLREVGEMIFGSHAKTQSEAIGEVEAKRVKEYLDMDIEGMTGETGMYGVENGVEVYYGQMQIAVSAQPGTRDELVGFWRDTQAVIAREAEVDRATMSPFDTSSQNTFLGSIVHKSLPVIAKMSAPLKAFTGFLGTTMSSLQSIIPIAGAAADENDFKLATREDCQTSKYLTTNKGTMAGNAYCFQTAYQDTSTTKTKLKDVYRQILTGASNEYDSIKNFSGVDSNGVPKVNPEGEYATWLVACSMRKSQWGYLNGQAASFIQEQVEEGVASFVNDVMEKGLESAVIENIENIQRVFGRVSIDWATGLNCMGGRDGSLSKQVALYAQFNTYMNMMEMAGSVSTTAQVAFLEDYYDAHPYYKTFEGIIAEYSGLMPDDVELALGLVEYYDFLAKYEPEELGPVEFRPTEDGVLFEETTVVAEALPEGVVFMDEGRAVRREAVAVA